MPEIPTPIRAYLGLLDTIVANGRGLVGRTPELPAILVGNALQLSMRATQTYTELATRGDLVLSRLHRAPEGSPAWATFDDELNAAATPAPASLSAVPNGGPRRSGLIDAEPFAPPAVAGAPHKAPVIGLAPSDKVAPAKKAAARKATASKATAVKTSPTTVTPIKTTPIKTTPTRTMPARTMPARITPANTAPAPAKAPTSPTPRTKRAPATSAPAKKSATPTKTSAPTRATTGAQLDQLELDPRAGAGNGGARPLSAFDRVGRLTDDLLAEVATAENDTAENDTAAKRGQGE